MTDAMSDDEPTGPGLDLEARFSLTLDLMSKQAAANEALIRRLNAPPMQPVRRTFSRVMTIPASGVDFQLFEGPDQGHIWQVRSIVIAGATRETAVAGSADVYVTAAGIKGQTLASVGTMDLADFATTLPSAAFYGNDELVVRATEHLWVGINGGTATQQVTIVARIVDIQEAAVRQEFST